MEHSLSDFSFIGIEQINNNNENNTIDKRLLTREAYWSAQLCTLKPYGLNKRCEFRLFHCFVNTQTEQMTWT